MLAFVRNPTIRRCLMQQGPVPPLQPLSQFLSLGVEGVGHHMLETLNVTLCPPSPSAGAPPRRQRCGGQASFPSNNCWRVAADRDPATSRRATPSAWLLNYYNTSILPPGRGWVCARSDMPQCPRTSLMSFPSKYIVLLREPADSLSSALTRFWRAPGIPPQNDTLEGELHGHLRGWRALDACIEKLSMHACQRMLFLSYELLAAFPMAHAAPLAAFLGVSPADSRLTTWLQARIRSTAGQRAAVVREEWRRTRRLVPLPGSPDRGLAKKLQDEVASWREARPLRLAWLPFEPSLFAALANGSVGSWAEACTPHRKPESCSAAWLKSLRIMWRAAVPDVFLAEL